MWGSFSYCATYEWSIAISGPHLPNSLHLSVSDGYPKRRRGTNAPIKLECSDFFIADIVLEKSCSKSLPIVLPGISAPTYCLCEKRLNASILYSGF
jgi:hypothetical protein